jgi:hypothetical protein
MLTGDLAMHFQRGNVITPKAIKTDDSRVLQTAADLILLLRQHLNQSHGKLQTALDEYIGVGTDYKILRGLIKLLLDRCEFTTGTERNALEVRRAVFNQAAAMHPITNEAERQQALAAVAEVFGCSPNEVVNGLYADLPANHLLLAFEEPEPCALLNEYNLAQAQALLYHCVELRLHLEPAQTEMAAQHLRGIFNAIKNYRLMHAIRGNPRVGYEVRLSGPVSLFHRSQKYGIQMAVFFPALLLYPGWHLRAEIETKRGRAFYELNHQQNKLQSSQLRETVQPENELRDKLRTQWRDGDWLISDNQSILDAGEYALIPDLVFEHTAGQRVFVELLGFWTPRTLQDRLLVLERSSMTNYLIVALDELRCSRDGFEKSAPSLLHCKATIKLKDLEQALMRFVTQPA